MYVVIMSPINYFFKKFFYRHIYTKMAGYLSDDDFDSILFEINEEYAGHTGKGAQSKAQEDGQYVIHCNPTVKGGIFYGYATHEERAINATRMSNKGNDVNERINGCNPCKAFLDVDASADTTDEDLTNIAAALTSAIEELCPKESSIDIKEYGYDSSDKRSRHFISNITVADGSVVARIARTAKSFLTKELAKFIDVIGNVKSFGLRIPYCAKRGDKSRTLRLLYDDDDNKDFWIQSDTAKIAKVVLPQPLSLEHCEDPVLELTGNALELAKKIAINFHWFDSPTTIYDKDYPDTVATLSRNEPHHCSSCDRIHDRRNAYIAVNDEGIAFFRCYAAASGSDVLDSYGAQMPVMPLDEYDILQEAVHVNGRYNSDCIPDNGGDLYISSSYGTGKSQHNVKILNAARKKNPNLKTLIVSARKTLSGQLANDMQAVMYNKIKGTLDTKVNPTSVWQIESLGRVDCSEVFDLIFIDELSSIASHAYTGNGKEKAIAGMSSITTLAKIAKRVIVSDNDLTSKQVESIKKARIGIKSETYKNDYSPWKDTTADIHTGAKSHKEIEVKLWERLNKEYALMNEGNLWHGTVVPCHSCKHATAIAIEARKRYGKDLVKLYTGETDDFIKQHDFSNATESWAGALIIIYTSTVSVGISCNLEHFDTVIAFYSSNNASVATSAQMLFRARQVKHFIIAFNGKKTFNLPLTRDKLIAWSIQAKNRASLPDSFRHDRSIGITVPSATNANALDATIDNLQGGLWVNSRLEYNRSQSDFVTRMSANLMRHGIQVTIHKPLSAIKAKDVDLTQPEILHPTPSSGEEPELEREVVMVQEVEAAVERECLDLSTERDRTYEEKAGDRTLMLARVYHVDHQQITPEWIKEYEPHAEQFKRFNRTIFKATRNGDELLKTSSETEGCLLAVQTLKALNFDINVVQTGNTISLDLLKTAAESMSTTINEHALRLYGDTNSTRRKKASSNFRSWCGTLLVPLKYIGISFEQSYKTKNDKKEGRNPIGVSIQFIWDSNPISPHPPHPLGLEPCPLFGLDDVYN
jgi:hypothetical protein